MWYAQIALTAAFASLSFAASPPLRNGIQQSVLGDQFPRRIRKSLEKAEIVPDVLDDDFKPLFSINVTYPSSHKTVDLGNEIKPEAVSSSPDLIVHAISEDDDVAPTLTIQSNATYTFILTDPDATSRSDPTKAEMCHWIVTGLLLNTSSVHQVVRLPTLNDPIEGKSGFQDLGLKTARYGGNVKELMSYFPPAPPPGTGFHRYVFALLVSTSNKDGQGDAAPQKPSDRPHWGYGKVGKGVRDWAKDNELTPVGANFFYAKNKQQ